MIRITSRKDGFRRAGIAHPQGTTEYPDDFFTPEQLEQICAEPLLTVTFDDAPAAPVKKKAK